MFISHINKIFTDTSSYRSTVVFDTGWVRFRSTSPGFFENKVVMITLTLDTADRTKAAVVADTYTAENMYFSIFLLLCPCLRCVSHQRTFHCQDWSPVRKAWNSFVRKGGLKLFNPSWVFGKGKLLPFIHPSSKRDWACQSSLNTLGSRFAVA